MSEVLVIFQERKSDIIKMERELREKRMTLHYSLINGKGFIRFNVKYDMKVKVKYDTHYTLYHN